MNYGMRFVTLYRRQGSRPSPCKRNAKKQNEWPLRSTCIIIRNLILRNFEFKGLDLIDRVPDELWNEVRDIVQEIGIKTISKKRNAKKENGCLRRSYKYL